MSESVGSTVAARSQDISLPWQGILLLLGCITFGIWNGWSSYHATHDGNGFYTIFLMTASLVFFLSGATIALQSNPDAGQPPLPLIVIALGLELAKAYLLYRLSIVDPSKPFADGSRLATLSLIAAATTAAITLALAAFVADELDDKKVDRWFSIVRWGLKPLVPVVSWLRARRVSALCCAFASFLVVTCFLTFAVAFDDRYEPGGSLFSSVPTGVVPTQPEHGATADTDPEVVRFYFDHGASDLADDVDLWRSDEALCEENAELDSMARTVQSHCDANRLNWNDQKQQIVARNVLAFCKVNRWLRTDEERSFRLLIVGHANPQGFASATTDDANYMANTALGRGRAEYIYVLLNQMANNVRGKAGADLRARLQYSVVGGTHNLPLLKSEPVRGLDQFTCVEVARQPFYDNSRPIRPKLDLLDYSYFMTYTITTTGYGDLMPITARTKFTVTLANLIEILYVPIIFILIIMRREAERQP